MMFRTSCCLFLPFLAICNGLRFLHIGEDELIKGDKVYIVHNDNKIPRLRHKRDLPGMPHELSFNFVHDDIHIHFNLTRGKQHLTTPVYLMNDDGIPMPTKSLTSEQVINQNSGVYRSNNNDGVFMVQKTENGPNNFILGGTFVMGNKEFTLKPGKLEDEHKGVHYIQDHSLVKRSSVTELRDRVAINYGHDWKDLEISNTENQKMTQKPMDNIHEHGHHHRRKRQVASHIVEMFILVDYFDYQKFYIYNNNDSTAAQNDATLFYAFIEECMNVKYGTIPEVDASLSVQIKSTGIFIATQLDYQQWINGNINAGQIDKDKAIVALKDYVSDYAEYLPKSDHIMAFTGGDLDAAAGYAYIGSICSASAVSLVENSFDGFSCGVAAHELGHSLNCVHDGLTGCSDDTNNIMATILNFPTGISDAPNPWKFSTCSVAAMKKQLQDVTCTNPENTSSSARSLSTYNLHSGQVYNADEQCKRISNDSTVRFCRNFYLINPSFDDMCRAMFCGKEGASCTYNIAYEGTSCGDRKWCEKGLCVGNVEAPSRFAFCPQGDDISAGCDATQCDSYSVTKRYLTCCSSCSTQTSPTTPPILQLISETVPTTSPITLPVNSPITSPVTSPITSPKTSAITSPVTSPITSQTTSPITSPVTSPITSPVTSPITSPTTSPTTSPVTSPITSQTTSPITSPVTSPITSPSTSPVTSPTTSPVTSPTTSPVTSPITSPTTSPITSPTISPITSPTTSPVTSPTTSPVTSPITSPVTSQTTSPVTSPITSPVTSPTTSPVTSPISSPTTSPVTIAIISPTTSPVTSPTTSPITSPITSPTINQITSPTISPITSPTTSPTTSQVTSQTSSAITSPITSPTTSPISSPVTSPTTSPVTSPITSPRISQITSPTISPITSPTTSPTTSPVTSPTTSAVTSPITSPTTSPITSPVTSPITSPTISPTTNPIASPTTSPTVIPTPNATIRYVELVCSV